ncbi:MAG: acylphosphatase [Gemmatimonadota bacterium]
MKDEVDVRKYRVVGRVQGVGFRWWTQKMAGGLGLVGRVRNVPDGSVDVRVAGAPDALGRFEEVLREGPLAARVDGVDGSTATPGADGVPAELWTDFSIESV